jgi:hypothetical protein
MNPDPAANEEPDSDDDSSEPGRSRDADMVEEARIAAAGGGVRGLPTFYQSLVYLILIASLVGAIWWAWSKG